MKMITKKENLDWIGNSPCQHLWKCMENSIENIQADVGV